jgi:hypothetical protein
LKVTLLYRVPRASQKRCAGQIDALVGSHKDSSANLAWWAASYSEELEDKESSSEIETGKFIDVLQRQPDGSWRFQAACIYQD